MPVQTSEGQVFDSEFEHRLSLAPGANSMPPEPPQKAAGALESDPGTQVAGSFDQMPKDLNLNKQEQDLYQRHLDNLNGPGGVDNPDGSRSTLFASIHGVDDKHYLIPNVWDGKILKPNESFAKAQSEGLDKFPSYDNPDVADARYNQMHDYMAKDTAAYFATQTKPEVSNPKRGVLEQLTGSDGGERYKLWPEKAAEEVYNNIKNFMTSEPGSEENIQHSFAVAKDLGLGGLATTSFKPGVGMFGGRMSPQAVATATAMEHHGLSPVSIKEMTGLERGADKMWRKEFSDTGARYTPNEDMNKGAFLSDVFKHDELFKTYPEAKDVWVRELAQNRMSEPTAKGEFNPSAGINGAMHLLKGLPEEEAKTVILHEMQHWIQHKEGFATGSSLLDRIPPDLKEAFKKALVEKDPNNPATADWRLYNSVAGEQEAFNVMYRRDMTPLERRESPGVSTETVKREHQIVGR